MNVLVSACLLGANCKYSGGSNACPALQALCRSGRATLIPACPEQLGGLATPRPPAERRDGRVCTNLGTDVTEAYRRGAAEALALCRLYGCRTAILKQRSPSCGSRQIYDGSFSGTLVDGRGLTAALLQAHGITVLDEETGPAFLENLPREPDAPCEKP